MVVPAEGHDTVKDDNEKIIAVIKKTICSTCYHTVSEKNVCSKQTCNDYYLSNRNKGDTADIPAKYNWGNVIRLYRLYQGSRALLFSSVL